MRLSAVTQELACPHCGQHIPPKRKAAVQLAEPFTPKRRPGGRQASVGPLVRVLSNYLRHTGYERERAERVARRLVAQALPVKQRKPRTR